MTKPTVPLLAATAATLVLASMAGGQVKHASPDSGKSQKSHAGRKSLPQVPTDKELTQKVLNHLKTGIKAGNIKSISFDDAKGSVDILSGKGGDLGVMHFETTLSALKPIQDYAMDHLSSSELVSTWASNVYHIAMEVNDPRAQKTPTFTSTRIEASHSNLLVTIPDAEQRVIDKRLSSPYISIPIAGSMSPMMMGEFKLQDHRKPITEQQIIQSISSPPSTGLSSSQNLAPGMN